MSSGKIICASSITFYLPVSTFTSIVYINKELFKDVFLTLILDKYIHLKQTGLWITTNKSLAGPNP